MGVFKQKPTRTTHIGTPKKSIEYDTKRPKEIKFFEDINQVGMRVVCRDARIDSLHADYPKRSDSSESPLNSADQRAALL